MSHQTFADAATSFARASVAWNNSNGWSELAINVARDRIEGECTSRVRNPLFVGAVAHTGELARVQPVVSGGSVVDLTILEGGSDYDSAPTVTVSSGTGFSATLTLTDGVVTGYTDLVGGTGFSATAGAITKSGVIPSLWTPAPATTGCYAALGIAEVTSVDGMPGVAVRYKANDSFVHFRPTLSSSVVSAGNVLSEWALMKWVGGSFDHVDLVGISFQETGGLQRLVFRNDLFLDYPDALHAIENGGNVVSDGVTAISSPDIFVSGTGTGVFDITFFIAAPGLAVYPCATSPVMPATGQTGASTRLKDVKTFTHSPPDEWTDYIVANIERAETIDERVLFQRDDQTDNNRVTIRTVAKTSALVLETAVNGSVSTSEISRGVYQDRDFKCIVSANPGEVDLTVDGGQVHKLSLRLPALTGGCIGNNRAGTKPFNGSVSSVKFASGRPSALHKAYWTDYNGEFLGHPRNAAPVDDSFTIVFLPDTHVTSSSVTEWRRLYNWILDNQEAHNIVAVIGEGDVITSASNASLWSSQFDSALEGWNAIDDADLYWLAAIGNHDYDTSANMPDRLATRFVSKFPLSMISSKSWFGGSYDGTMKNCWIKFDYAGRKFLVLTLEIWPDDSMLAWGLAVCNANLDREVIFVTHSHSDPDGTLTVRTDTFGPGTKSYATNDGPEVYAKFGRQAKNLRAIISGHQYRTSGSYRKSSLLVGEGLAGNKVNQVFANYQEVSNGNGMVTLLRLHTNSDYADIRSHSALTGMVDPASVFRLDWPRPVTRNLRVSSYKRFESSYSAQASRR